MISYKLDIGGREEQQDSCIVLKNRFSTFLIVADGMGGHSGGALASKTLIKQAQKLYKNYSNYLIEYPKKFFQEIVDLTQQELKKAVEQDPSIDPHTTCVMVLVQEGKLHTGHIGDSRMYLFINKKFKKRSKDHSVVQMLLNEGEITEEEMATHPDQNKLLKSIGYKKDVTVTYKTDDFPKNKDNAVLVCSDGFWEQISVNEMEKELFKKPLDKALENMVKRAKQRGGKRGDNISVAAYIQKAKSNQNFKIVFGSLLTAIIILSVVLMNINLTSEKEADTNSSNKTKQSLSIPAPKKIKNNDKKPKKTLPIVIPKNIPDNNKTDEKDKNVSEKNTTKTKSPVLLQKDQNDTNRIKI